MGIEREVDWQKYIAGEERATQRKIELFLPPIIEALGQVDGLRVMDFGSGDGWLLRSLKGEGALSGVGIERVPGSLARARKLTKDRTIKYLPDLESVPFNSIDKAVSNNVLMEAATEEELRSSFQGIYDKLKPGGIFVYLITHPAFIERPFHDSRRDFGEEQFDYTQAGRQYDVVIDNPDPREKPVTVFDYHYPLATYMNIPQEVGFRFERLREVSYPRDFITSHYPGRTALLRFPPFLVWKGTKSSNQ